MSFWNSNNSKKNQPQAAQPHAADTYVLEIPQSPLDRFGKVKSALSAGTSIHGKLSFDTSVRIDGTLSGEVTSQQALIIGREGVVDAKISTQILIVEGEVRGEIQASERVEILEGGVLTGTIHTQSFVLHEGGVFNGDCQMKHQ